MTQTGDLDVFLVAGEASGDELGRKLMIALRTATGGRVAFRGVGGAGMAAQKLDSRFPMSEIALVGIVAVVRHLPLVLRRVRETAAAIIAAPPDVLVLIDSPDFTHRVARKVRRALPDLPIVTYVSPTVWAWRAGRAPAMKRWCDHILALLPFEPQVHHNLGGPRCTYVGHPLVERLADLRPKPDEVARRRANPPLILALPGSRRAEIAHLLATFGATLARITADIGPIEVVLPTLPHLRETVEAGVRDWPVRPIVVESEAGKLRAFRRARAALAASGTVTLELALSGVPMVSGYRGSVIEYLVARRLVRVPTIILANLVLGRPIVPELLQRDCVPEKLAPRLIAIIREGAERDAQLAAFSTLDEVMHTGGEAPSDAAARLVIETYETKTGRRAPRP